MKYLTPNWVVDSSIKAYTTVREAWGKRNPNEEDHREEENALLRKLFDLPTDPIWLKQVHSKKVVEALSSVNSQLPIADAIYTRQNQQICMVLTGDCLPILLCDKQATCVAAIHAGWRGLAEGIIFETLDHLKITANDVQVWLGPAIGPQKFEVGEDVYSAFTEKNLQTKIAFSPIQNKKWLADLYELARIQFREYGVNNIWGGEFCTYTQAELFYSYRRDGAKTGRMASLIWMES